MDRQKFRKEYFLNLVTSPGTAIPFVGGTGALGAGIIIGLWPLALGGLVVTIGGIGVALRRFVRQSDKLAEETRTRIREQEHRQRQAELDALDQQLQADDDPRPENLLRELRRITDLVQQVWTSAESWAIAARSCLSHDIMSQVERLFATCVEQIRQTMVLWEQMKGQPPRSLATRALKAQRETLIGEVEASVGSLAEIVRGISAPASDPTGSADHISQARRDLEESLRIGERVRRQQSELFEPPAVGEKP